MTAPPDAGRGPGGRALVQSDHLTDQLTHHGTDAVNPEAATADAWAALHLERTHRLQSNARSTVSIVDPGQCAADLSEVVGRHFLELLVAELRDLVEAVSVV